MLRLPRGLWCYGILVAIINSITIFIVSLVLNEGYCLLKVEILGHFMNNGFGSGK